MARTQSLRYTVDGSEKSYADDGPALSLSLTLALRAADAGRPETFYVRDAITDKIVGFSESQVVNGIAAVVTQRTATA